MEQNIPQKLIQKGRKISMKYRYDSNHLKGNRRILEAKLFSPQRALNSNIYSNEDINPAEYSINYQPVSINYESMQKLDLNHHLYSLRENSEVLVNNFNTGGLTNRSIIDKLVTTIPLNQLNQSKNYEAKTPLKPNMGRKLESATTAFQNQESIAPDGEVYSPRESQTNYYKTRLPYIKKEVAKMPISTKVMKLKMSNNTNSAREITTSNKTKFVPNVDTTNSHINDIDYFKESRNSIISGNYNYAELKKNMGNDVIDSSTFKFDVRKHSVNPIIQINSTLANSSM